MKSVMNRHTRKLFSPPAEPAIVPPNLRISSRCVASKLRSRNKTYHNVCRSLKLFRRNSGAVHARPKVKQTQRNVLMGRVKDLNQCPGYNHRKDRRRGETHLQRTSVILLRISPFSRFVLNNSILLYFSEESVKSVIWVNRDFEVWSLSSPFRYFSFGNRCGVAIGDDRCKRTSCHAW